jgi:hypothetical protein
MFTDDGQMNSRYYWQKRLDKRDRFDLIDVASSRQIGTVQNLARRWHWQRFTSLLLHGAPPANGTSRRLCDAKKAIAEGLPDAPLG